jgi:NAD(P)-dependent dehydrogenase (short-subunit alcohol dehydrogenase family)
MDNESPLAGKTTLITGASRGIGLAIARRLGRMGARLSLCARNPEALSRAASQLHADGIEAIAIPADLTRSDEIPALVAKTRQSLGEIEILVNNAGVGKFAPFHEVSDTDWDTVLDTNLKAVFLLSKAVAPDMIRRRYGHIINIASLAGKNSFATGAVYCASKWGLLGLTYCMAEDLRGHGIRVAAICPGTVATEFSPHAGKATSKMLQPDDVAHAVEMIVRESPQSFISEVLLRPTQKP